MNDLKVNDRMIKKIKKCNVVRIWMAFLKVERKRIYLNKIYILVLK